MSAPSMHSATQTNPHFEHVARAPYELGHLLKKMPADFSRVNSITADDRLIAEAAIDHARNANDTLMHGLEALGHLMFVAGTNDNSGIDSSDIASLGYLISHIAVESEFLQETKWSIREILDAHDECAAVQATKSGDAVSASKGKNNA